MVSGIVGIQESNTSVSIQAVPFGSNSIQAVPGIQERKPLSEKGQTSPRDRDSESTGHGTLEGGSEGRKLRARFLLENEEGEGEGEGEGGGGTGGGREELPAGYACGRTLAGKVCMLRGRCVCLPAREAFGGVAAAHVVTRTLRFTHSRNHV